MRQFKFVFMSLLLLCSVAFSQSVSVHNTGNVAITYIQDISPFVQNDAIGSYFVDEGKNFICGYIGNIQQNRVFPVFGDDNTTPCKDGFTYNDNINYFLHRDSKFYNLIYDINSDSPGFYSTSKFSGIGIIAVKSFQISDEIQTFNQPLCEQPVIKDYSKYECIVYKMPSNFEFNIYSKPGSLNNSFAIPSEIRNHVKIYWEVVQGNGKLYFADTSKPKYQISQRDRKSGTVLKFLLTVTPKNPNCPPVTDAVTVTLI